MLILVKILFNFKKKNISLNKGIPSENLFNIAKNQKFELNWLHHYCVKSVRIRSYSGPNFSRIFTHSDWIRRDIPEKWGKNTDQNNSKYGHFLRSAPHL